MKYYFSLKRNSLYIFVITFIAILNMHSAKADADLGMLDVGFMKVHYGVYNPHRGEPEGDVLYLHGYGDTFVNHTALFKQWNDIGLRVISFDFPSHGKTEGVLFDDLDWFSFTQLAYVANTLRMATFESNSRPFFLAGWSTGGLLALRIAQDKGLREKFPPIKGLVLFAPGVSVKLCVGNSICQITNESISNNKNLQNRKIMPTFPFSRVGFASTLLYNASLSWQEPIPENIPALVFVASIDDDKYVKSEKLIRWVALQRLDYSSKISDFHCSSAKHELDNEPLEQGGPLVRELSADFISAKLNEVPWEAGLNVKAPCRPF